MLDEVELVEIAFDIEVQYRLDGLAVVGGQHHTQQAAHDEGVAVSVKMQLVSTALMHQPDLTLTTPDKVLLGAVNLGQRSEEHTSELQSRGHLVCRLLLEKKIITQIVTCCYM